MKKNSIALISRIREKSGKFLSQKLEENGIIGVVPSHGDIMAVLFRVDKCTMKELALHIHRTKATLTVLVDKLIKLELVVREKSAEDSRVTYIKLTQKGQALKPVFDKISAELNSVVYNGFSKEEAETLEFFLEKLNSNFD